MPKKMITGVSEALAEVMAEEKRTAWRRGPDYLRSMIDGNSAPVLVANLTGEIVDCNAAAGRWCEAPVRELRDRALLDALGIEDKFLLRRLLRDIVANGSVTHAVNRGIVVLSLIERSCESLIFAVIATL